ncbi:MAG: hypothetical protein LBI84_08220 [Propionibacteriaceae bacterium]|nr:hypothetical protein [Propionibacteriaceae bacterium]
MNDSEPREIAAPAASADAAARWHVTKIKLRACCRHPPGPGSYGCQQIEDEGAFNGNRLSGAANPDEDVMNNPSPFK